MAASRSEISAWFDTGASKYFDYMIVVCDDFNHEDFPVWVNADNVWAKKVEFDNKSMHRVIEVYNLHEDRDLQMSEGWVMRLPSPIIFLDESSEGYCTGDLDRRTGTIQHDGVTCPIHEG